VKESQFYKATGPDQHNLTNIFN